MKHRIIASTLAVAATLASIPSEAAPVYRQAGDSNPRVDVYQQSYTYAGIDKNDTVSIFLKVSYNTLPLEHAIIELYRDFGGS